MIRNKEIRNWFSSKHDHEKYGVTSIFGVEYAHLKFPNEDDLYLTAHGLSMLGELGPSDFRGDSSWFKNNPESLKGTGCVFKVKTSVLNNGQQHNVVFKWNRMGQDVPGKMDCHNLLFAEFNSPFEEFSLLENLSNSLIESGVNIIVQKPLGIYVPSDTHEAWQTGRRPNRMKTIINSHTEIELDLRRLYMLIFEWLDGIDAAEAFKQGLISEHDMNAISEDAKSKLDQNGFVVRDHKPNHVIFPKTVNNTQPVDYRDSTEYGLIDYELLEKTDKNINEHKSSIRIDYHRRQKERFSPKNDKFPPHLKRVNILGVDYIYGRAESTKGRLWVVGRDPYLFDYFLPDRWKKSKKTKIMLSSGSFHTITKDNIHIVLKDSKVGLIPDRDPFKKEERQILEYGYNSPFEEIALAEKLRKANIATIYPRAIYMSGLKSDIEERCFDNSRYISHEHITTPDGFPVLMDSRSYVSIWGYWNGPDELLAEDDVEYCEGVNLLHAYRGGLISYREYMRIIKNTRNKLSKNGIKDLNLRGRHILISVDKNNKIVCSRKNVADTRLCNFEFLEEISKE